MFQSTHSLRSATFSDTLDEARKKVSIHALLAECDKVPGHQRQGSFRFNPRTPCGVRPQTPSSTAVKILFQSTHSLRSATPALLDAGRCRNVSIHALLAECDVKGDSTPFTWSSFNPRTPCGVRLFETWSRMTAQGFNPRTPCGVRRLPLCILRLPSWFQSTHSLRSATSTKIERQ